MNIRLVSGDHIETARVVARKAGILSAEDEEQNESDQRFCVMHADTFEQKVGMNEDQQVQDMQMFR